MYKVELKKIMKKSVKDAYEKKKMDKTYQTNSPDKAKYEIHIFIASQLDGFTYQVSGKNDGQSDQLFFDEVKNKLNTKIDFEELSDNYYLVNIKGQFKDLLAEIFKNMKSSINTLNKRN